LSEKYSPPSPANAASAVDVVKAGPMLSYLLHTNNGDLDFSFYLLPCEVTAEDSFPGAVAVIVPYFMLR